MTNAAVRTAIEMIANMMRVTRGAGRPERIVHDAAALVAAFDDYFEVARHYPGEEVAEELRRLVIRKQPIAKNGRAELMRWCRALYKLPHRDCLNSVLKNLAVKQSLYQG